jgi:hypothetical protein
MILVASRYIFQMSAEMPGTKDARRFQQLPARRRINLAELIAAERAKTIRNSVTHLFARECDQFRIYQSFLRSTRM